MKANRFFFSRSDQRYKRLGDILSFFKSLTYKRDPPEQLGLPVAQDHQGEFASYESASGIPGPTATSSTFGYLGCYIQTGGKGSSTGLALSTWKANYGTQVDSQCSQACFASGYIFFGTIILGTTSTADCWCGNNVLYVTSAAGILGAQSVTGEAGEENCVPCIGAAVGTGTVGECGNSTVMTVAIFARTF
ncbi:hypothetical protein LTR78_001526 [Recurvomyces mirabilis]|uniref:WSC domain-containing protein n=1 Tax=Recurvomyces mirabilis TaxID=574656 RepID=A0AAE0WVP0_9PEZI|nr:hypothetical protein LTR78_001526 [Recurvomyces mirabilis]